MTRVTHTLHSVDGGQAGFEFLGVRVWQKQLGRYGGSASCGHVVTLLHPSQRSVSAHLASLNELFRTTRTPEGLITRANPKIRGWTGYFRQFNSKRTFSSVDHHLWFLTFKWTGRNFKGLGRRERVERFYPRDDWRFQPSKGFTLLRHADVAIEKRRLVRGDARYYSADWPYWATRTGDYPLVSKQLAGLLKRQFGKCARCQGSLGKTVLVTKSAKTGYISAGHSPTCPDSDSGGRP